MGRYDLRVAVFCNRAISHIMRDFCLPQAFSFAVLENTRCHPKNLWLQWFQCKEFNLIGISEQSRKPQSYAGLKTTLVYQNSADRPVQILELMVQLKIWGPMTVAWWKGRKWTRLHFSWQLTLMWKMHFKSRLLPLMWKMHLKSRHLPLMWKMHLKSRHLPLMWKMYFIKIHLKLTAHWQSIQHRHNNVVNIDKVFICINRRGMGGV